MTGVKTMAHISPSVLACDFARIEKEVQKAESSGADSLHLDIMDGHFVPNISFGPPVVASIKRSCNLFLYTHLMIYNPIEYVLPFAKAGANGITVHIEASEKVEEVLEYIRKCHLKVGLSLNPETPADFIFKYLPLVDMILVMTVKPGFGGQEFIPEMVEKIRLIKDEINRTNAMQHFTSQPGDTERKPVEIQVDGGINIETAILCAEAGASNFVAGSHLFGAEDMKVAIDELRSKVR